MHCSAFSILLLTMPASAQQIDNRPVFYIILQALERAFIAHSESIERAFADHSTAAKSRFHTARGDIEARRKNLLREQRTALQSLLDDEHSLNMLIAAQNQSNTEDDAWQRLGHVQDDIEELLGEIQAHHSTYTARLDALRVARIELRDLSEGVAKNAEIREFTSARADYLKWLTESQQRLTTSQLEIAQAQRDYQRDQADHARDVAQLRTQVAQYNDAAALLNSGQGGASERTALQVLGERIQQDRSALDATRLRVIAIGKSLSGQQQVLKEYHASLQAEQKLREQTLRNEQQRLATPDATSLHAQQSRQVEALTAALHDDYGPAHVEIHQALADWLDGDPSRASYPGPRKPRCEVISTKMHQVTKLREQRDSYLANLLSKQSTSSALTATQHTIANDKRALDGRRQRHSEEFTARLMALKEEAATLRQSHLQRLKTLQHIYTLRLDLSQAEFSLLQDLFSDVLNSGAQATTSVRRDSIRAELAQIAESLGDAFPSQYLRTDFLFEELTESFPQPPPDDLTALPEDKPWLSFRGQDSISERELSGAGRQQLAWRWAAVMYENGVLADPAAKLSQLYPMALPTKRRAFFHALLSAGIETSAQVSEHLLNDGRRAIRTTILNRRYWLNSTGSLETGY